MQTKNYLIGSGMLTTLYCLEPSGTEILVEKQVYRKPTQTLSEQRVESTPTNKKEK